MKKITVGVLVCLVIVAIVGSGVYLYREQSRYLDEVKAVSTHVEASCVYLGTDYWYINNGYEVDSGCKPASYMIFVNNYTDYNIDNIMMQTITRYPNTISETFDMFGEGCYGLLSGESGNSNIVTLQVSKDLTDEEIYKALSSNKLQINVQVDKCEQTVPVRWRRSTKQEIRDYAMPDDELE